MGVTCGLNIQLGWFLGNEAAVASVNEPQSGRDGSSHAGRQGQVPDDVYQHMATLSAKPGWVA
jgi:hypothetical protein